MGAPLNNRNGVGHGRPRKIDREVARLAEAAGHARALLEQRALAGILAADPEIRQVHDRRLSEGIQALAKIEAQLATLRELAEVVEEDAAPTVKGRRRKRRFTPDPWATEVAAAAAALDRLVPDDERSAN